MGAILRHWVAWLTLLAAMAVTFGMVGPFIAARENGIWGAVTWGTDFTIYHSYLWPFMARTNAQLTSASETIVSDIVSHPWLFVVDVLYWAILASVIVAAITYIPRSIRRFNRRTQKYEK
jgi:hypothetical protein